MSSVYEDRARRLKYHIESYREHRREARHLVSMQFEQAEKRARGNADTTDRSYDLLVDPRDDTAAIVEWDEPNAWIRVDHLREVRQ